MDVLQPRYRTFVEQVLIVIGFVIAALLILLLLYYTFDVVLLILGGILLAIFLRGLADLLGEYVPIGPGWRVMIVSVILIAVLGGAIALLSPSIAEQVGRLRVQLPESARQAGAYISQFGWGRTILQQLPSADDILNGIGGSGMISRVGGIFSSTIGALGNFFIVILLAIYLASEPRFYADGFTKLFPMDKRKRVDEVLSGIGETLRWWLIGKAASMLFIGVITWIGLSILGVPLALTLGLIAGLLSFIPNFGPILSALPALLLGFIESPLTALKVLILFVGVQVVESNIVTPLIERETVELPPAMTIIFQLALAVLVGGLGLVLATPLLAVVMVIVQMVYIQDVLGDREVEVSEKAAGQEVADKGGDPGEPAPDTRAEPN